MEQVDQLVQLLFRRLQLVDDLLLLGTGVARTNACITTTAANHFDKGEFTTETRRMHGAIAEI